MLPPDDLLSVFAPGFARCFFNRCGLPGAIDGADGLVFAMMNLGCLREGLL